MPQAEQNLTYNLSNVCRALEPISIWVQDIVPVRMETFCQDGNLVQRHDIVPKVPQLNFRERIWTKVVAGALIVAHTGNCG